MKKISNKRTVAESLVIFCLLVLLMIASSIYINTYFPVAQNSFLAPLISLLTPTVIAVGLLIYLTGYSKSKDTKVHLHAVGLASTALLVFVISLYSYLFWTYYQNGYDCPKYSSSICRYGS